MGPLDVLAFPRPLSLRPAVNRHACVDLSRKTRMSKAHTKKYQQQKHFSFED
jgi:hypothetical protein